MRHAWSVLLLPGCAAPVAPGHSASVKVTSLGELGRFTTRICLDDRVLEKRSDPGPARSLAETTRVVPGAHDRIMAVIAAVGPAARAANRGGPEVCMDCGHDRVRIEPATPALDMLYDDCPDVALTRLMGQVLAAIAP